MPRPDRIMEHKNNHNQHNGSGNGFLLGVIVGVLITLLFTTQRGRAILKEVMEKGIDKFANLEELMRETEDDFDDEEGDDYIPAAKVEEPEPPKVPKVVEKKPVEAPTQQQPAEKPAPKPVKEELVLQETEALQEETRETVGEEPAEGKQEEKPKAARVKRLFRGLRKKS